MLVLLISVWLKWQNNKDIGALWGGVCANNESCNLYTTKTLKAFSLIMTQWVIKFSSSPYN